MDEEAGFIAALLADPDDRTVLLVYADWLDEHNESVKAAYLRLLVAEGPDHLPVVALRERLNVGWVQLIASRGFAVGDLVEFDYGEKLVGTIVVIEPDRRSALIESTGPWGAVRIAMPFTALRRLGGAEETGRATTQIRRVKPRRPPRPRRERWSDGA